MEELTSYHYREVSIPWRIKILF